MNVRMLCESSLYRLLCIRSIDRGKTSRAFRKGKTPLMVATGVSARGIDVKDVMHIINYDLPSTTHGGIQEYIHRIGKKPSSRASN